ncbi:hypothetical protein BE15_16150 [Sorangium cellulosum]|uniref:Uncharacterized protein n=1 Tax=Sorangium cellulosum TaxID=56 RepID=A0A150QQZ8_SORCE|nr:hypothetical protein BE15_16150 [Sorangium cellulosum]
MMRGRRAARNDRTRPSDGATCTAVAPGRPRSISVSPAGSVIPALPVQAPLHVDPSESAF